MGATSEQVVELADQLGLSERTVWRWFARMRAEGTPALLDRRCGYCGGELPPGSSARREYCDDVCRQYARRERLALPRR
jgi:hypothetical protein